MKHAVSVVASLSADAREKELRDQMSREQGARDDGRAEGIAVGSVEGKLEMARNLFRLGVSRDVIAKSSGLNEAELRGLEQ